jgi:undecaprenyl-diphosphatase
MARPSPPLIQRLQQSVSFAPKELRLLGLLLAVTLLAWLAVLAAARIGSPRLHSLDNQILLALRHPDDPSIPIGPPWLLAAAREITALGSATVLILLIFSVVGYLWLEQRYGILTLVAVSSFGGMMLSWLLKGQFGRMRPSVVPHLVPVSSPSFPSGHSLLSAVVYLTLGVLLARATSDRRAKTYFIALAATITVLIGLSRIYLGVHYPSDVLGGWVVGLIWALLCGGVARELQRRRMIRPAPAPADQRVPRSTATT